MTLEQTIARLDEIIKKLSTGETTLDESLDLYSEGIALAADGKKAIEQAKLKIQNPDHSE